VITLHTFCDVEQCIWPTRGITLSITVWWQSNFNLQKVATWKFIFLLQAALEMIRFQLRHGNDLLAVDCLRKCDVWTIFFLIFLCWELYAESCFSFHFVVVTLHSKSSYISAVHRHSNLRLTISGLMVQWIFFVWSLLDIYCIMSCLWSYWNYSLMKKTLFEWMLCRNFRQLHNKLHNVFTYSSY